MLVHADELSIDQISSTCNLFNTTFSHANPLRFSIFRYPEEWIEKYISPVKSGDFEDVVVSLIFKDQDVVASTILTIKKVVISGEEHLAGFIDDVAVHPKYQGRGLGKKVFRGADEALREHDMSFSMLFTTHGGIAHRMYEKFGYKDAIFLRVVFRVVNRRDFARLISRRIFKLIPYFLPKKKVPECSGITFLKNDSATNMLNKIGLEMNLYSRISPKRLKRAQIVAYKNDTAGIGSIRLFANTYGSKFRIGIVSNIVTKNIDSLTCVVSAITKKLEENGVIGILSNAMEGTMLRIFKKAGYHAVPRRVSGMVKPIKHHIKLRTEIAFLPTEHIIGEW